MGSGRKRLAILVRVVAWIGILGCFAVTAWVWFPTEVSRQVVDGLVAQKRMELIEDDINYSIDVVGYGMVSVSDADYDQLMVGRRYGLELVQEERLLGLRRTWSLDRLVDQRPARPGDDAAVGAQSAGTSLRAAGDLLPGTLIVFAFIIVMGVIVNVSEKWAERLEES